MSDLIVEFLERKSLLLVERRRLSQSIPFRFLGLYKNDVVKIDEEIFLLEEKISSRRASLLKTEKILQELVDLSEQLNLYEG